MQTDLLLDQFDTLLTTPDDVAHLEATVLQLAVQGKLVRQDPDDEPATELFEQIKAEKQRLVREKQILRPRKVPTISPNETSYKLPRGWVWTRLGEITTKLGSGSTPRGGKNVYQDQGIKFIRSQNVWNDGLRLEHIIFIPEEINERMSNTVVKPKDVLLNITGASIGRTALVPDDFDIGNVSQHVAIVRLVDLRTREFIHFCLMSPLVQRMIWGVQVGISRPGLSMKRLSEFLIPLPPLVEQERIIARIKAFFTQTRALATQLEQADAALIPAAQAAFQSLLDAQDTAAQREAWQRIADHFDTLTSDLRTIEALKQTVLQLAVQGKLVPQDPDDEPASVLIEHIKVEKEQLVREGKIRKPKPLPPIEADEVPYDLPVSWVWARLGEITDYGSSDKANGNDLSDNIWVLDLQDIEKRTSRLLEKVRFSERPFKSAKSVFCKGDVLYGKLRPYLDKVLVADEDGVCSSEIIPIRGYVGIDPYYLRFALKRLDFIAYVNSKTYGVKMPRLGTTDARMALIPLPPLAEQKRIVAKVEALLALCDALAAEVAAAEEVRARLLQAVLNGG